MPCRRWPAPPLVAAACALAVGGCGSSAPPRVPTSSQLTRLRGHLAVAVAAAQRRDRAATTAALDALGQDVQVLGREGTLNPRLAATLATEVAHARRRAGIELPAPAPVAAPAPAPATTTPPVPTPAAPSAVPGAKDHHPAGPAAKPPKPHDHGKHKGHGDGGD